MPSPADVKGPNLDALVVRTYWDAADSAFSGGAGPHLTDRMRDTLLASGYHVEMSRVQGLRGRVPVYVNAAGDRVAGSGAVERARQLLAQQAAGGPSIADRMPATSSPSLPPWYAVVVPAAVLKKARKVRAKKARKAVAKKIIEHPWAKKAAEQLLKKFPRLARIGAAARGGAWFFGGQVAWETGQWIGGEIYKRYTDWQYGPGSTAKPTSTSPTRRKLASRKFPIRITRGRIIVPPAPTIRPTGNVVRPSPGQPSVKVSQRSPGSLSRGVLSLPSHGLKVFGSRVPSAYQDPRAAARRADAQRRAAAQQARRAAASKPAATTYKIPTWAKVVAPAALGFVMPKGSGSPSRSLATNQAYQPEPGQTTLTDVQPLALSSPRAEKCHCKKPKKKSGKAACRNPVTSRRKTTRGGQTYITTTRRLQCRA